MKRVKKHFGSVAVNYNKNRSNGILGNLVKREKKVMLRFLNVKKHDRILDAGCGSGFYSRLIKEKGAGVYGLDISLNMIKQLKKERINGSVANIENFNLNKKFDKVLCAGALEFLDKPKNAINCFYKHLEDGGYLVLLYPRRSLFSYLYFLYHLIFNKIKIKLFSKEEIYSLIIKNGFSIINHKDVNFMSSVIKAKKN